MTAAVERNRVGFAATKLFPHLWTYLLQHDGLLLLEQSLELLRREDLLLEDLLHLLRCDHLGAHHGHRDWDLQRKQRSGTVVRTLGGKKRTIPKCLLVVFMIIF